MLGEERTKDYTIVIRDQQGSRLTSGSGGGGTAGSGGGFSRGGARVEVCGMKSSAEKTSCEAGAESVSASRMSLKLSSRASSSI